MKKLLQSLFVALLLLSGTVQSFSQERLIREIHRGSKLNAEVTVEGHIFKIYNQPSSSTYKYVLKDSYGDRVDILSSDSNPAVNEKYSVKGIVAKNSLTSIYYIIENSRRNLSEVEKEEIRQDERNKAMAEAQQMLTDQEEAKKKKEIIIIIAAISAVVLFGGLIIFLLIRNKGSRQSKVTDLSLSGLSDAVVNISDKTQKISAPVAEQKAVEMGTVKIMPGRFEVKGGVDLKEIRLIRPSGVAEHAIEYTFGRLTGDLVTHIQLNDQTVSSNQAKLKFKSGVYSIINIPDPDDPDRNATMLNGKKMNANESIQLKDGDTFTMGSVNLIYKAK